MVSTGQILGFGLTCLIVIAIPGPSVLSVAGRPLAASAVRSWFARSPRRFELVGGLGGLAIMGVGVTLALTGRRD